jgi:DNA-binding NtrC family response regulator
VSEQRLNLSKTNVLILQNNATELDILGQMFIGFAVKTIRKCLNVEEADLAVRTGTYDLIVVDADLPDNAGLDFIAAVRRQSDSPNKLVPRGHPQGDQQRRELRRRQAHHPQDDV